VKCLYKYVYKGHDRVIHGIQNDEIEDEVVNFQESIYISSSEACWRIFQFEMHRNYPNITRLAVHLKNLQIVRLMLMTMLKIYLITRIEQN
jgi:hypothetical protein